jgi:ATP/maltotriose-dependent transcriptional regulator MalT
MSKNSFLNPSIQSHRYSEFTLPDVLGEFYSDRHHFLIIGLKNEITHLDPNLTSWISDLANAAFLEVGRFEINGQLCAIIKAGSESPQTDLELVTFLTERELQIATFVALGRSNKQIANQLHISEWTVSTHLRRIFIKLKVDSRAAMVYRCAALIDNYGGSESCEI